jgi:hypothetical protein
MSEAQDDETTGERESKAMAGLRRRAARLGAGLVVAGAAVVGGMPQAHAQGPIAPMEIRTCRYAEGKSVVDVETLGRDYNRWLDEAGAPAQSIHVWLPQLHGRDLDHDFAWVVGWPDALAMGESMAAYEQRGAALQARFAEVGTCDEKRNFSMVELRGTAEPGVYGPVEIASCTLRLGSALADTLNAVRDWVDFTATTGSTAVHWLLFKAYGERADAKYMFQWAVGYESYEAFGRDYDKFTNGDGSDTYNQLFELLMTCDNPRLYSVRAIRAPQW